MLNNLTNIQHEKQFEELQLQGSVLTVCCCLCVGGKVHRGDVRYHKIHQLVNQPH
jgi:hypothetical protein